MKKEDLLKFAGDERFISGIYNYCDRWCERCDFTSRCMNFAVDDEEDADPESLDIRNKAFWNRLSETFQVTLELIQDMAEREGIDLDAADDVDQEQERLKDEAARSQKCCRMAKAYADMVRDWYDSAGQASEQEEGDQSNKGEIPAPDTDLFETHATIDDALEVVSWYQHQIHIKLMRAARSALREKDHPLEGFAKDSDGSAKVALIGIERSMAAWGEVRPHFILYEAEVQRIMIHLESLRQEVEKTFPKAREFIRPGFDEVNLNS